MEELVHKVHEYWRMLVKPKGITTNLYDPYHVTNAFLGMFNFHNAIDDSPILV